MSSYWFTFNFTYQLENPKNVNPCTFCSRKLVSIGTEKYGDILLWKYHLPNTSNLKCTFACNLLYITSIIYNYMSQYVTCTYKHVKKIFNFWIDYISTCHNPLDHFFFFHITFHMKTFYVLWGVKIQPIHH